MSLQKLFAPRGVVVVGSASQGKLGYHLTRQLLDGGYQDVYVVNPRAQAIVLGAGAGRRTVPGYDAVAKIEHPVDLAVIASPSATVPDVLADCGKAGVQAAVIITAGYSEVGNYAGEAEIKRVAKQHGIRFVGPNCAGIVNTFTNLFPTLETRPPLGGAALVTQSGAVGGVFLAWAKEFGLGVSKFVSYGNGADLNEIELLHYLAEDPETEVVALYIESVGAAGGQVSAGRAFMEAVQMCSERKPLVVMKAGRTRSGRRATLSHTGSVAGADTVYDAALRQCGATRVHTIEDMFDLCLGFLYTTPPKGRRLAIVTNSGGPAVLTADWAEQVGLEVVEPDTVTKEKLEAFLPVHCAFKNPIDLTVEGTEGGYRKTLLAVLETYDAALALNVATPYLDSVPLARGVCDAAQQSDRPVVASFLPGPIVAEAVPYLQAHGVPNFPTGERAVTALARMAEHAAPRTKGKSPLEVKADYAQKRLPISQGCQMLEPEAIVWLGENGIPVPELRWVAIQEGVTPACHDIGYPVVMKVVSPEILHKSDLGGVILDIRDDDAALVAFKALQQAAAGRDFRGVVIYPMIKDAHEVLLGLSRDPQFGPVVAFGWGGIYTEVWRDISLRVAPIDRVEAEAMIQEIKAFPLLQGARGQSVFDVDALANLLVKVAQLPFQYPDIGEVDLNPVFLFSRGLVVGDARVIRRSDLEGQAKV